jgi:hypothetical protein
MCIIIDANLFSAVVDPNCQNHLDFKPVLEWVQTGHGKLVHGGSHYKHEIERHQGFRKLLYQMEHRGKTILVPNICVDEVEKYLIVNYIRKDFDDHHIVAILLVSNCILVCTKDNGLRDLINTCYQPRSKKLIKNKCQNLGKLVHPRIYKSRRNIGLLSDEYILT